MESFPRLMLGLVTISLFCACRSAKPPVTAPSTDPTADPPRIYGFSLPESTAVGSPLTAVILVQRGNHALTSLALDFDGDQRADTTVAPAELEWEFRVPHIFPRVRDVHVTVWAQDGFSGGDSASRSVRVLPFLLELTSAQDSGIAPLDVQFRLRHEAADSFRLIRVDSTGDGVIDTVFVPHTSLSALYHCYGQPGVFNVWCEGQLGDTVARTGRVIEAINTPPRGELPVVWAEMDSTPPPVNLEDYFSDAQTPAPDLEYELTGQVGPAYLELQNHLVVFTVQSGMTGSGSATVRVSDPDGGEVRTPLAYTIGQDVVSWTMVHIGLADLEWGTPVDTGTVFIRRRAHGISAAHMQAVDSFPSVPFIEVSGYKASACSARSYQASLRISGLRDTNFVLPVVTYDSLKSGTEGPRKFSDLNRETRVMPVAMSPTGDGLVAFDFANAWQDTLWVAAGDNGGWTPTEQDLIADILASGS